MNIYSLDISQNLILKRFHVFLLYVLIFSLFNDLIGLDIGFRLLVFNIITLIYLVPTSFFIYRNKFLLKLFNPQIYEWLYLLLLTLVFGFLFPWDYLSSERTFFQNSQGRSIVTLLRLCLEIYFIFFIIYLIRQFRLKANQIMIIIANVTIFTFVLSLSEMILNNPIKSLLGLPFIELRFNAINGEPRVFGRVMVFANIIMYFALSFMKSKKIKFAYFISLISILISFSASSVIAYLFIVLIQSILFASKKNIIILIFISLLYFAFTNERIIESIKNINEQFYITITKIELVLSIDKNSGIRSNDFSEPEFFSRFEVFDRAALNFLWNNPLYIFIGTGPNLISIPASLYIDEQSAIIYGDVINSVPHTFIINLISRSGLIGLFYYFLFFQKFNSNINRVKNKNLKLFFYQSFCLNLVIASSMFLLCISLISYFIIYNYNDFNNNANFKFGKIS